VIIEAIEAADITSLRELSEQKEQADKELNLLKHEPVSASSPPSGFLTRSNPKRLITLVTLDFAPCRTP
jgi:hypothetical protein